MNYWGVDIGSRRLAVYRFARPGNQGTWAQEVTVKSREGAYARHEEVQDLVEWFLEVPICADDVVAVEKPPLGVSGNPDTLINLAVTLGAVLATSRGATIAVGPTAWKAALLGHGHADKTDIRSWLETSCPAAATACGRSQDLCDAACLALYAEFHQA